MYFAQHRPTTQYLGWRCPVTDTPHYKYLCGDEQAYIDYLLASWQTREGVDDQLRRFDVLINEARKYGIVHPVVYAVAPDGCGLLIDGNHRSAISEYFGLSVRQQSVALSDYLDTITRADSHRYGTAPGKPYQSVFYGGKEYVTGRRRDTLERQQKIGRLDGKTVVDFGCNTGAACLLACEFGATGATGIEFVPDIALVACRLNAVFNQPIRYEVADLSKPYYTERADVGFVFSLDIHVNNDQQLAANIRDNVNEVVYFECHTGAKMPAPIRALFRQVDHIGTNYDNREFYRCFL